MKFKLIFIIFCFTFVTLTRVTFAEENIQNILINEVFGNPSGSDTGKEWIELYNNSNSEVSIQNWKIVNTSAGGSTRIFTIENVSIQSYSFLIIKDEGVQTQFVNTTLSLNIFNSGGTLELFDSSDNSINKVMYESLPDGKSIELNGPSCNEFINNPQSNSIGIVNFNYSPECWGESLPKIENINFVLDGQARGQDTINSIGSTKFSINFKITDNIAYTSSKFELDNGKEISNPITLNNYFGKKIKISAILENNQQIFAYSEPLFIKPNIFISEVYPSPDSSKDESEWIEIYNKESNIDLSGWYFSEEVSGNSCSPTSIKLDGLVVKQNEHLVITNENFSVTLNNGGDEIYLCNDSNILVSKIEYPEVGKGMSFAKDYSSDYLETFSTQVNPTPGSYTDENNSSSTAEIELTSEQEEDPGTYSLASVLGARKIITLRKPSTRIINVSRHNPTEPKNVEAFILNIVVPFLILVGGNAFLIYKNRKMIKIFYGRFVNSKQIKQDYFKHFKKGNDQLFS